MPLVDKITGAPEEINVLELPPIRPRLRKQRKGKKRTKDGIDGSITKGRADVNPLISVLPDKEINMSAETTEHPPAPTGPQEVPSDDRVDSPANPSAAQDTKWTRWSTVFYIGLLNTLALLCLTLMGTSESHLQPPIDDNLELGSEPEPEGEQDGGSDSQSVASSRSSSECSCSSSASYQESQSSVPSSASESEPSPPPSEQEWKDLLTGENGNVVLGLRVYTQTKDPAGIVWRGV